MIKCYVLKFPVASPPTTSIYSTSTTVLFESTFSILLLIYFTFWHSAKPQCSLLKFLILFLPLLYRVRVPGCKAKKKSHMCVVVDFSLSRWVCVPMCFGIFMRATRTGKQTLCFQKKRKRWHVYFFFKILAWVHKRHTPKLGTRRKSQNCMWAHTTTELPVCQYCFLFLEFQ